jgi:hypothetical protein
VITNGDHEKTNYVLDWCAHMVQRPWENRASPLCLARRPGAWMSSPGRFIDSGAIYEGPRWGLPRWWSRPDRKRER